ncbi:hypothetical protein EGM88_11170 [Aureibaculum marinum]|uniref:Rieske domain-containing protein n=1 Tax=Aureibaculum marinum TaxID=2487930 RepID=A0A3N4NWQ9_9FLAO|nr:hypothetical protein [Aureibaculum marinum]RPD96019.1 hypothetical protein EGM88_11170 [Aureibaculum marinum]
MKNIIVPFLIYITLIGCSDTESYNNPYLPDVAVNQTVYLNNPSNNDLLFDGGYVEISGGIKGIVVYHGASDIFYAYDLACPNSEPNSCVKMTVDGLNMICSCDDTQYALALGGTPQNGGKYGAKEYKVINNGQSLLITNF